MKDIEQYKKRFYNLMESTIGDVKPLLFEDGYTNDLNTLIDTIYNSRNKSWDDGLAKSLAENKEDIVSFAMELINWGKKNPNYNDKFFLAAICLLLREGKASEYSFYHPKEILGAVWNYFGGDASQGYGQVKPSTAKQYNLNPEQFNTLSGSIDGLYKIVTTNYNEAKKYYSGEFISKCKNGEFVSENAIGQDAALHMAIAAHNGGLGMFGKYCQTNIPCIANKCNVPNRKPYDDDRVATTNTSKPLQNYFPNIDADNYVGGTHGYMVEVITNYNAMWQVPGLVKKLINQVN